MALLTDAATLFDRGSHGMTAFLAITALEQTAKAHLGVYRRDKPGKGKGRDPLRDHQAKHSMASLPIVYVGLRLTEALGADAYRRLQAEAKSGFARTRKACLYAEKQHNIFTTPAVAITGAGHVSCHFSRSSPPMMRSSVTQTFV